MRAHPENTWTLAFPRLPDLMLQVTARRAELSLIREDVVARECEIATLRAELGVFDFERLKALANLYAELDEIDARIAEALLSRRPHDSVLHRRAREAAERWRASAHMAQEQERRDRPPPFDPSPKLKALYRSAARLMHPDLALEEAQLAMRHDVMVLLNAAYERGDTAAVEGILEEWVARTRIVTLTGSEELGWLERSVSRLRRRLETLAAELAELRSSDLFRLRQQVADAWEHGLDLLGERQGDLRKRIRNARDRLARLTGSDA